MNQLPATRESVGVYYVTLDPDDLGILGRHSIKWEYTYNGEDYERNQWFEVVIGYTSATIVKSLFPSLASVSEMDIYTKERLARRIINTFCNQVFDFEIATEKKVSGSGSDTLYLPRRIYGLDSVILEGEDITSYVEIAGDLWLEPADDYEDLDDILIAPSSFFKKGTNYYVTGDWGWDYVPIDIQDATAMLIWDYFNEDYLLRQHGIWQAEMGDEKYRLNNDFWNTTGNYDVDILLSNYIALNVALI